MIEAKQSSANGLGYVVMAFFLSFFALGTAYSRQARYYTDAEHTFCIRAIGNDLERIDCDQEVLSRAIVLH